jgi:D-alanyl-D-alanine carboxypeptidase-like protein
MRRHGAGVHAGLAVSAALVLLATGCGGSTDTVRRTDSATAGTAATRSSDATGGTGAPTATPTQDPTGATGDADATSVPDDDPSAYAVPDPGRLSKSLLTADVLVTSSRPIPKSTRDAVATVPGVAAAQPLSVASLSANGRTMTIAAVDPGEFRRFTPVQTAQSDEVWSRVAGGEIAVDPSLPRRLEDPAGYLRLGTSGDSPQVHIGAYAPMVKQISAVVNYARAKQLGIPENNAILVSTGKLTPSAVVGRLKKVVGRDTTMQTLALEFNVDVPQTAVLSGASVSDAVGTFTYTPHANGTLSPDSGWIREFIRTEQVPILGSVTCNKGMLPQLRGALTEIVQRGLADEIHPDEYAGCYYPRFIARDPSKGLSLHSWGIAVDLNVPENQRGTVGEMDRQVVAVFKKYGFAWGGDWSYTDPMHFEMAKVVQVR